MRIETGGGSHRPALRRARVVSVSPETGDARLVLLDGPMAGREVAGVFHTALGEAPREGDEVLANALGLEMGLGTGGLAVVSPGPNAHPAPENRDHFVKLPYTPLQFPAPPPLQAESLFGKPVVVLPLHSHLAPACCAAADLSPGCRVAFVWQEGGALPVSFSRTARLLKEEGLLHVVVSVGACFGGDVEAPNVFSGLLAAALEADLVLVGIGPGVVGTGTPYGHGGMSAATALNAALALGSRPVLAPRLSAADPRGRHRGVSHHTRSALGATLAPCRVALPAGFADDGMTCDASAHEWVRVGGSASGYEERFGVTFGSMGRSYAEDPVFFDAAACAVALALGGGA